MSKVHTCLVAADNALLHQSSAHPDGWGVAYYHANAPHVIRSVSTAVKDSLFKRVSGLVSSETVLAHLRKATHGELTILNTHPFQYGRWTFAHNGNIKGFSEHRDQLMQMISPELRRFILGETDSELLFFLVLSHIKRAGSLDDYKHKVEDLSAAVKACVADIIKVVGPFHDDDKGAPEETYLTFIITNGAAMIAHQGGKDLFYSTYKTRCSERETCPSFSPECEAESTSGRVNHLIFSSEPLSGENIWIKMKAGAVIAVDVNMELMIS